MAVSKDMEEVEKFGSICMMPIAIIDILRPHGYRFHRPIDIGGSVYLPIAMSRRLEELFGVHELRIGSNCYAMSLSGPMSVPAGSVRKACS